CTDWWYFDVW
nr:immunoglobulin heavy chain junction region [Mus musculus]